MSSDDLKATGKHWRTGMVCVLMSMCLAASLVAQDQEPTPPQNQERTAPEVQERTPEPQDETRASSTDERSSDIPHLHPHRQQRDKYIWGTFGPPGLISAALSSAIQQWRDVPEEWEQDKTAYAKRFAAGYAGSAIGNTTKYVVARLLDEDPSFRPCRCSGVLPRLRHATVGPFLARKPDGRTVFSFARVAGMTATSAIANNTWLPGREGAGSVAKNVAVDLAGTIGVDLLREFVLHHRNTADR